MFVSMKSWRSLKMSDVESKTRSLVQILVKSCVRHIGYIFNPICMKLRMFASTYKILDDFENGSRWVKN